jgi:anti-sigma B factor antagonist
MHADVRRVKDATLIQVSGRLTTLDTWGQLKEIVAGLVHGGDRRIVLNLSQLTFVDSTFIGELVACSLVVARAGGSLRLSSPSRRIQELLLITRLGQIFETYETDTAALAGLASGTP